MIKEYLFKYFGFNRFMPGQEEVINFLVNGQSTAAIFPTGGGKSLCYQLSALILDQMTLVVSPLLSLMKDQIDFLNEKKIPAAKLDSTLEKTEQNRVIEEAKQGKLKILMISVERFRNERFRIHLKDMRIALLVVDEAHCISEWGHNFRPDYLKIPSFQKSYRIKQALLLTATATEQVIKDMCRSFDIPEQNVVIRGFYRENLHLHVTACANDSKDRHLLNILSKNPQQSVIVYVTLQKTAEMVAEMLQANGIYALPYHAGKKNEEREDIQNRFMRGEIPVIAATIAFGMGIDKEDIREVIHYNLPKSLESYSQEIGRAGRDGKDSRCEVLADRDNICILENFIYGDTPDEGGIKKVLETILANPESLWEIKLYSFAADIDIRVLPLKTLLVYLELQGIIKPKYTYFREYSFKLIIEKEDILNKLKEFKGEITQFARVIFRHSITKKIWTTVNITAVVDDSGSPRERVIKALEYFDDNKWIELRSQQGIDVYEIINRNFDIETLSATLTGMFKKKEKTEINRIHKMLKFFESDSCLSVGLSNYFGETGIRNCGHCSVCKSGKVIIPPAQKKEPLSSYPYKVTVREIVELMGDQLNPTKTTKFLCGISTPLLSRHKVKQLSNFGLFEEYPFKEVKKWVNENFEIPNP